MTLDVPLTLLTGSDADHSQPSSVEVNNEWGSTSNLPTCRHNVNRENVTAYPEDGDSRFLRIVGTVPTH
jgi:hypothetical protein